MENGQWREKMKNEQGEHARWRKGKKTHTTTLTSTDHAVTVHTVLSFCTSGRTCLLHGTTSILFTWSWAADIVVRLEDSVIHANNLTKQRSSPTVVLWIIWIPSTSARSTVRNCWVSHDNVVARFRTAIFLLALSCTRIIICATLSCGLEKRTEKIKKEKK